MKAAEFRATLRGEVPPEGLPVTLAALWWDAKGDWVQAHGLVDELETPEGMAVHAYLHRKEGSAGMRIIGMGGLGAGFVGRSWKRSGRRWWRGWRSEWRLFRESISQGLKPHSLWGCWIAGMNPRPTVFGYLEYLVIPVLKGETCGTRHPILSIVELRDHGSPRPYGTQSSGFLRGPRIPSGAIFFSSLREEGQLFIHFGDGWNHLLRQNSFFACI